MDTPVRRRRIFAGAIGAAALIEAAGLDAVDLGTAPDDPALTRAALAGAADCDALVTSGGVSVGEENHVRAAVGSMGGRIDHWKLAIKPGKPLAVGSLPGRDGRALPFLGLPGNPNAVFVTLCLAGLPLLRTLAGLRYRAPPTVPVVCADGFRRAPGRPEYMSVALERGEDGRTVARRLGSGGTTSRRRWPPPTRCWWCRPKPARCCFATSFRPSRWRS